MNKKHAYLIMAHHRFDILKEILKDLDDERNDIFLHIDIKAKNFDANEIKTLIKKANLILIERMDIHWGGYSQIECVVKLLKIATVYSYHSYYHFMVGVEFPLKTQDYIHEFFRDKDLEFIGFDEKNEFIDRVKFYHPFNEYARNSNFWQKVLNKFRIFSVSIQRLLQFDLTKKYNYVFKKGNANWSITHELAKYVVSKELEITKMYKHSFCGDEVFIHTLVYNSKFWDKVYNKEDEYMSSMRMCMWDDEFNQYHVKDLEKLILSNRLFARKIDGCDAMELIDMIREKR